MADSIREQIIQKFVTLAAGILTDEEYQTDIGENVFRAADAISEASLEAVNVIPRSEEAVQQYIRDVMTMTVQIEGFRKHGTANPSVVSEKILADLRKCFTGPTVFTAHFKALGVQYVQYRGGGMDTYAKPGEEVTGSMIRVEVKYSTAEGNPYA